MVFASTLVTSVATEGAFVSGGLKEGAKIFSESINNMKTVANLGKETYFIKKYEIILPEIRKQMIKKGSIQGFFLGLSSFIIFGFFALIPLVGAYLFVNEGIEYEKIFLGMYALSFATFDIGNAQQLMPDVGKALASAKNLFEYIDAKSEIDIEDKTLVERKQI